MPVILSRANPSPVTLFEGPRVTLFMRRSSDLILVSLESQKGLLLKNNNASDFFPCKTPASETLIFRGSNIRQLSCNGPQTLFRCHLKARRPYYSIITVPVILSCSTPLPVTLFEGPKIGFFMRRSSDFVLVSLES
jgi:hypothetical protein